jgi:hypothetical protein
MASPRVPFAGTGGVFHLTNSRHYVNSWLPAMPEARYKGDNCGRQPVVPYGIRMAWFGFAGSEGIIQMLPIVVPLGNRAMEAEQASEDKTAAPGFDGLAVFDFGGGTTQGGFACISTDQQADLQAEFKKQLAVLQGKHEWLTALLPTRAASTPHQFRTDFHICVSPTYKRSRSLVPAWSGRRGSIELPAYRVVAGEAALAHELVHVLFPNGNRMLAEGLAVYLQQALFPDALVYPNFGDHIEALVADFIFARYPRRTTYALWSMDLSGFERISTPDELTLRIGTDPIIGAEAGDPDPRPEESKFVYGIAGSFVKFLLENPLADPLLTSENFAALYRSTPLKPLERSSGPADRWQGFYAGGGKSYSFEHLGLMWKTLMHFLLCSKQALEVAGSKKEKIDIPAPYRDNPVVRETNERLNKLLPP